MEEMGKMYVEFPSFDLKASYDDSSNQTPLIFILSTGADPRVELDNLANSMGMKNSVLNRSLGQG